jgi:serine protease Do
MRPHFLRHALRASASATAILIAGAALAQAAEPQPTPPQQIAKAAPLPQIAAPADFSELARTRVRSVVAVASRRQVEERQPAIADDSPFGESLRRYYDQSPRQRERRSRASLGSGFLVGDSFIVTNNHVIDSADEIRVVFYDRVSRAARLIGTDPATDIAVLKLDQPAGDYPPVEWGDSEAMHPGAWTIAIGSSFGLGGTVTVGVLSARSRDINGGPYDDFLQTDASINSGNSGGPLFNAQGQVIGVNTAIVSPSGGNVGIGFAVPANVARQVAEQIIRSGRVERGFIGVTLQPLTPGIAQALKLPNENGALVSQVEPGSPAAEAGLRAGDVITRFADQDIASARTLPRLVAQQPAGQRVSLTVLRDGQTQEITVAIGRRGETGGVTGSTSPNPQTGGNDSPVASRRLGVAIVPIDDNLRRRFGLDQQQSGLLVQRVEPGSPAAEDGLRAGDIIVEANGQPVSQPADIGRQWQEALAASRPFLMRVRRGEQDLFVAVGAERR